MDLGVSKMVGTRFDTRWGVRRLRIIQIQPVAKVYKPPPVTIPCPRLPPQQEGPANVQVYWKTRLREAREALR